MKNFTKDDLCIIMVGLLEVCKRIDEIYPKTADETGKQIEDIFLKTKQMIDEMQ